MRKLLGAVVRREAAMVRLLDRVRRAWLVWRIRFLAAWKRTTVDLDVAPDLRVGWRVVVRIAPRSHLSIRIGPRCRIGNDVHLYLMAGSMVWEEAVQLRVRSAINLTGELWLEGGNIFSYGCVIHCLESIRMHKWAGAAEYTTIADSGHFHTEPDRCVSENTVSAPVVIGTNVFLAPRVQVNRGVTIGDFAIVGPNSVVLRDVPPGCLASGVPAEVVRKLELPWEQEQVPAP